MTILSTLIHSSSAINRTSSSAPLSYWTYRSSPFHVADLSPSVGPVEAPLGFHHRAMAEPVPDHVHPRRVDSQCRVAFSGPRAERVTGRVKLPVREPGPREQRLPEAYLSYESLRELVGQKPLSHLSDTVLDEYAEEAE